VASATTGAETSGEAVPFDTVPVRPALLARVVPEYPMEARRRQIEGLVLLRLVVDQAGRVEENSIAIVSSIPALDAAAVGAVRQWRFRPGRNSAGQAVRVVLEVPIRFALR
jgi:protein TonB